MLLPILTFCLQVCQLAGAAQAGEVPDADKACVDQYESRLESFALLSGVQTTFVPEEHRPAAFWEHLVNATRRALGSREQLLDGVHSTGYWAEALVSMAETQLFGCWIAGGRFWEVELPLDAFVAALPRHVSELWIATFGAPALLRSGFCAPSVCEASDVETIVVAKYLQWLLARILGVGDVHVTPLLGQAEARELSHWSKLSLDFVVAGLSSCGTTSLHRNLALHSELAFTTDDEDNFFNRLSYPERKILPLKIKVDEFNHRRGMRLDQRERSVILGLCNPAIFQDQLARNTISRIPHLKVVIVVCDPLSRMEKLLFATRCARHAGGSQHLGGESVDGGSASADAKSCLTVLQEFAAAPRTAEPPQWLAGSFVGSHLRELRRIFGPRLLVLHQEQLRLAPLETYANLAAELGASRSFPAGVDFRRYNSMKGPRTGMCSNMSLVHALQRRLGSDYNAIGQTLAESGVRTGPDLLFRTRCHRKEELSERAPHCPNRTACRRAR
eukprot:TRINITY_DN7014_c0_g1_i3.p1 TRINITY_DN7014_c0_g1~~TRINITY_DN7014_c0_g1_i3.p1  ORF type:complete len:502 (-),score=106.98 TRINITY_DN7014_c0_g1_i3:196-1701(-)